MKVRQLKKHTSILLLCIIIAIRVTAQNKTPKITLTLTDNGVTHCMPVTFLTYDFNKFDQDAVYTKTSRTVEVMISCKIIPAFIYKAASGTMTHRFSACITCYGKEGKKNEGVAII